MKRFFQSDVITTGLAIFSMFFGAGNLMYPIKVGEVSGDQLFWGMLGFCITSVLLPVLGLIGIILFEGNYKTFFYRLGELPGFALTIFCTTIIGPLIAMPRIVTLSYEMLKPFLPSFMGILFFSILFLFVTFLATYKESKIVTFLGNIVSPILLISLTIIIATGVYHWAPYVRFDQSIVPMFLYNLKEGYQTLDLLGGIFFSSIVISILKKNIKKGESNAFQKLAIISLKAGLLGAFLLALVYIGLGYLGAHHAFNLNGINEGQLFSALSFRIVGCYGAAFIALAVLMACYSTIVALTAVYAEFLTNVSHKRLSYTPALIITLVLTLIPSIFGLDMLLKYSKPIIFATYPALIMLTLCNIGYKLFNFKPIKTPFWLTLFISLVLSFSY